jgi:NADPH2:quinone reductase
VPQIATLRGARVIGTTSSEKKAALARQAGADEAISYERFAECAREITGSDGVAAVYDGVGNSSL